ncbi:hypothetical protein EDC18_106184 [Natranaerovirga pectinivora]|uniref:Uncharacterized protein n=1 Tax=Natranaerovirga pectinivora TaxID=682400 RepID=A0A4R3MJS8_9FIRM|nr:DUF6512 family protein [Natranaerovirga pectinivora]TCT14380.1 hypothetical protein EDC18_106184 [Natranaerovirga pectinivora]
MQKKLYYYEILMFFIANVLMFLLHDAYSETGLHFLSYISAVNESIYEHMKMTFFSLLIVYVILFFIVGKRYNNYWFGKFCALIIAPFLVMVLYYTYSGVLGYNILWIDILIGVLAILTGQIISYYIISKTRIMLFNNFIWFLLVVLLAVIFSTLTYNPIHIDLFKDNRSGRFGV